MKFDVIIGNPPYQLDTGGSGRQAKPIYQLFVRQAKKLNPRFLTMIIPSRWFSGGMGLDDFRDEMLNDDHLLSINDFPNAKDCFPQNSISGGVCYFLRSRDNTGDCSFSNIRNGSIYTIKRRLDEFPVLVRYNEAVAILRKVLSKKENTLSEIASSLTPFGLPTNFRGSKSPKGKDDLIVHSSEGVSYISPKEVEKGNTYISKYKILMSKTGAEHAGEPDKDGKYRVLTSSMKVLKPKEICTHSYFVIGEFEYVEPAENLLSYLKTRFVRFLVLQSMSSINVSKSVFQLVPIQDFSKAWTDEKLYKKYDLSKDEIAFIESMIKPMEMEKED
jgi:site-specific DNA-methyltransferase (adenine-specific)